MKTLVIVLNPRQIPQCVESIKDLKTDKAWCSNFTEYELMEVIPQIVNDTNYDLYSIIADDCVVTQTALDAVTGLNKAGHPVTTGYCNLDLTMPEINICKSPLSKPAPEEDAYEFYTQDEIKYHQSDVIPTYFTGMAFTTMSRELWQRFPFKVFGGAPGYASDYHLSLRLQEAGIPIVAHRDGYVLHVKEQWCKLDTAPEKRLLIGECPSSVTIETYGS